MIYLKYILDYLILKILKRQIWSLYCKKKKKKKKNGVKTQGSHEVCKNGRPFSSQGKVEEFWSDWKFTQNTGKVLKINKLNSCKNENVYRLHSAQERSQNYFSPKKWEPWYFIDPFSGWHLG